MNTNKVQLLVEELSDIISDSTNLDNLGYEGYQYLQFLLSEIRHLTSQEKDLFSTLYYTNVETRESLIA